MRDFVRWGLGLLTLLPYTAQIDRGDAARSNGALPGTPVAAPGTDGASWPTKRSAESKRSACRASRATATRLRTSSRSN